MVVMTAKVNKKKIILILAIAAILVASICALRSCGNQAAAPDAAETAAGSNEARIQFLNRYGWEVAAAPLESQQVRIPTESNDVYNRYNDLQVSQGYDLTQFAGKSVMRYVYEVTNYPDATEPVYATLLVYKDRVIGGDVTSTAATGSVHGFRLPQS